MTEAGARPAMEVLKELAENSSSARSLISLGNKPSARLYLDPKYRAHSLLANGERIVRLRN